MAKYSKGAGAKVEEALHDMKTGKLTTGSGKKVSSKSQAIAIGLSEAREAGEKVPQQNAPTAETRSAAKKGTAKKAAPKKSSAAKAGAKKTSTKRATPKKATAKKATVKKSAAKKGTASVSKRKAS